MLWEMQNDDFFVCWIRTIQIGSEHNEMHQFTWKEFWWWENLPETAFPQIKVNCSLHQAAAVVWHECDIFVLVLWLSMSHAPSQLVWTRKCSFNTKLENRPMKGFVSFRFCLVAPQGWKETSTWPMPVFNFFGSVSVIVTKHKLIVELHQQKQTWPTNNFFQTVHTPSAFCVGPFLLASSCCGCNVWKLCWFLLADCRNLTNVEDSGYEAS